MAITNKEQGVWGVDQVFNKINEGGIWTYDGERELWAWGKNDDGNLGQNDTPYRSSPVQVPGITWSSVSQAYNAIAMIKTDGTAWMMGGAGGHTCCQNAPDNTTRSSPIQVGSGTDWNDSGFATGTTVFFTKTNGELWVCGANDDGKLGVNEGPSYKRSSPVQIPGTTWSRPFSSVMHVGYCLRTDGTLWSWGRNQYGELGLNEGGTPANRSSPTQIGSDTTWTAKLASSSRQTMAIKTDGTLWGWGNNDRGCLGMANHPEGDFHAHQKKISSPSQVGSDTTWSQIGCAHFSSAATKTDGTLWAWGTNQYGELGQNNRTFQSSPVQIPGTNWKTVRGGSQGLMYGQKTDGTLWAWGRNFNGSIGQNQASSPQSWSNSRSSPVQVPGTSWNLEPVEWANCSSITMLKNV